MAYKTTAEIVAKVKQDLRNAVDSDTLVAWLNDVQEDIFCLDLPLFLNRVTDFTSTDDLLTYTISAIASDVRKIKEVYIDLEDVTSPYAEDYEAKRLYRYKYLDFSQNGTYLYLEVDPDGYDLTVVYYRTPTQVSAVGDT